MKIKIDAFAYPDSATINGVLDPEEPTAENPAKRPFLVPDASRKFEWRWQFEIDTDEGKVVGWPAGVVADIWDKPCDDCAIIIDGKNLNDGEYVPRFLRPKKQYFEDDYIIAKIDGEGHIEHWDKAEFEGWYQEMSGKWSKGGAE